MSNWLDKFKLQKEKINEETKNKCETHLLQKY